MGKAPILAREDVIRRIAASPSVPLSLSDERGVVGIRIPYRLHATKEMAGPRLSGATRTLEFEPPVRRPDQIMPLTTLPGFDGGPRSGSHP